MITNEELKAIRKRRYPEDRESFNGEQIMELGISAMADIPALLAEVERLRQLVICDCCGKEGSAVCNVCDNDD